MTKKEIIKQIESQPDKYSVPGQFETADEAFNAWYEGSDHAPICIDINAVCGSHVFEREPDEIFRRADKYFVDTWVSNKGNAVSFNQSKRYPILKQQTADRTRENGRFEYIGKDGKHVKTYSITADMFKDMIDTFGIKGNEDYDIHHKAGYRFNKQDRESRNYNAGTEYLLLVNRSLHNGLLSVAERQLKKIPDWKTTGRLTEEQDARIEKALQDYMSEYVQSPRYAVLLKLCELYKGEIKPCVSIEYIDISEKHTAEALTKLYKNLYMRVLLALGIDEIVGNTVTVAFSLPNNETYVYQCDCTAETMTDITAMYRSAGLSAEEQLHSPISEAIRNVIRLAGYKYLIDDMKPTDDGYFRVSL